MGDSRFSQDDVRKKMKAYIVANLGHILYPDGIQFYSERGVWEADLRSGELSRAQEKSEKISRSFGKITLDDKTGEINSPTREEILEVDKRG